MDRFADSAWPRDTSAMTARRSRRALVAQALGRVLGREVGIDECRLLGGSTGKRSYRVAAEGRHFAVRLGDSLYGATLSLDQEAELMRTAAAAGLAPEVVGTDPATGTLVTRWLAGARAWTETNARRPREIGRIAALLRKLHALNVDLPPFEARRIAGRYVAEARRRGPRHTMRATSASDSLSSVAEARRRRPRDTGADSARLERELMLLAERYDERFPPSTICHNDLVAANILDTGGAEAGRLDDTLSESRVAANVLDPAGVKLIDFEHAVLAHPVLDLASVAAMNRYDARRRLRVVEAYYPGGGRPFGVAGFDAVVRMLRLLTLFWARAQPDEHWARVQRYADHAKWLTEWP